MESKKAQKLSKATVATVLATSGVIVALPQPSHAYTFKDVDPMTAYYEPIMDLANRKIATGYSDGTFKPNVAITREDAARMLALTIDVNITNPKNPGFKDVNVSNPNYRYIAALAEAGIINGFTDKTFKPKEPITRGQMAKIITLGFEFGLSTKLNHGFKDVKDTNIFAYHIQTLYDLSITKGTSAIEFGPTLPVTRGQMATFIWRAEQADRGKPVYVVGDIIGDQVYINGVAHTIASHLRSILSPTNKNILNGAHIEGDFSGNKINNITKLTINASGTASRLLAMDGNYTGFAGELVINGNYLRFKNINFTGRVEVAQAPRRSLAALTNLRVASVGPVAQFIDWTTPTPDKNEDFLNPSDKETLVDKPDPTQPNTKYKDRMPNLKKYVDFDNSELRHVYVSADHTFLQTSDEIDRLYIEGDVSNVEFYGEATAMYIDTDYNLNVYGAHDVRYFYKNSLKNIHLKSDAVYDYYYITSGHGYTNLGDHAYITDAIIPPKKTVNDVFDDYENDEPQIGIIKDEDGKIVPRDPVDDTIVPDVTSPTITQLDVDPGGTIADVTLTADEDGTYYYVIKRAEEKAPTINQIKTGGSQFSGKGEIVMDEPAYFQVAGLTPNTDYVIYAIVIDAAENVSEKESTEFTTVDNQPPTLTLKPGERMYGGKRLQLVFDNISEPGEIYYYIREKGISSVKPSVNEVIERYTARFTVTEKDLIDNNGQMVRTEYNHGFLPNLSALQPNTTYEVFAVMIDKSSNKMTTVAEREMTTEMADTIQPYVANNGALTVVDEEKGIFEFTVSERLDPETASVLSNYTLSGTGVVNISGHKTINPSKVELITRNNQTVVRLTIPALNALVKGDTIRVTVSKNVLDLAENAFESPEKYPETQNAPRNEAYYTHADPTLPTIRITNVIVEGERNLVEFVAPTKAGTYYYMILEDNYDFAGKGITARDFLDEFSTDSATKTTKFGAPNSKDYTGNLQNQYGPAELGVNTKSVNIDYDRLNPFKSYSVYMVLKDRAGLVSEQIVSAPIVSDTKAPLIYDLQVNAQTGSNTSAEFKFVADEPGELSVIAVKKYLYNAATGGYQLNTQYFNPDGTLKEIANVYPTTSSNAQRSAFQALAAGAGGIKRATFNRGDNTINISNLDPHQEYGFYVAADDKIGATGNFTIFGRRDNTNPANPAEPNGSQMIKYVYTDGVAPSVNEVIARKGELTDSNPEFTITFSEAIMRQKGDNNPANFNKPGSFALGDILEITDMAGRDITNQYYISEPYGATIGTATTQPSTLKIKLSPTFVSLANANRSINVKLKENKSVVYDYVGANGVNREKNIGTYLYPDLFASKITDAILTGYNVGTPANPSSKTIRITAELDIDLTRNQRYYYAVTTSSRTSIDPQLVLNLINDANTPNNYILTYGSDVLQTDSPSDKQFVLNLTAPPARGTYDPVFTRGNHIFFFTVDKYGNIVWALNNGTTNKYRVISNDLNIPMD